MSEIDNLSVALFLSMKINVEETFALRCND